MIYILIVLWWPASSQSGKAMMSQEFNTVQSCEAAKRTVLAMEFQNGATMLRAVCVPK